MVMSTALDSVTKYREPIRMSVFRFEKPIRAKAIKTSWSLLMHWYQWIGYNDTCIFVLSIQPRL